MKFKSCAYCGEPANQKEHAIPKCLYPKSKSKSKLQRLTVPACNKCNNSWADDEAHSRNMLLLAGKKSSVVGELWETTRRSFDKVDGRKRLNDLFIQLKPVETPDGKQYMVYPGKDERVIRVVRKIVRGLCYHHNFISPVLECQVWADVMKFNVPQQFLDEMKQSHIERDIIEYKYQVLNESGIHSGWLLTFFNRCTFIALVSISKEGFKGNGQEGRP